MQQFPDLTPVPALLCSITNIRLEKILDIVKRIEQFSHYSSIIILLKRI